MSFSDVAAMHTRKRTASSSSASEVPVPSTGDQATDSAKRDVLPNSIHTPTSVTHDRRTPKLEPHSTRYSTLEVGTPTAGVGVSWPSQRTAASTRAIAAADSYAQLAKDNLGDDVKAPPRGGKTLAAVVRLVKMTRGLEQDYSFRLFNRAVRGTTLDKELEEKRALSQKKRMKYIILPDSRFHSVWDSLSLVWIFLNVLMVPYWVAFDVETGTVWFVVDLLVDVWFCVDILLNFRTAYADDGDLQTHWKSIAFHYLRTYFALDVLATFPFAWVVGIVVESTTRNRFAELPTLLRMVRLVRMIKIIRLFKAKRNFHALAELGVISKTIIRVVWLTFWMTAIGHVLGCFWALIFHVDTDAEGWAVEYGVDANNNKAMYLSALYFTFATLTTVGYGDVSARTNTERVYALFLMLVGAVLFATIVGRMSALAAAVNRRAAQQQQAHDNLAEFMQRRELPKPMRQRLRSYFHYTHLHNFQACDDSIFAELSPSLRREVLWYINQKLIATVPFLRHAEAGFVNYVITKLQPVHCIAKDYIILAGEIGEQLYMLRRGDVDVVSKGGYLLKVLHSGSFFGEIACLQDCPRTASVRARTSTNLLSLHKKDLLAALAYYPSFAEGLAIVAQARKENVEPERRQDFNEKDYRAVTPPMGLPSWASVHRGNAAFHARALQFAANMLKHEVRSPTDLRTPLPTIPSSPLSVNSAKRRTVAQRESKAAAITAAETESLASHQSLSQMVARSDDAPIRSAFMSGSAAVRSAMHSLSTRPAVRQPSHTHEPRRNSMPSRFPGTLSFTTSPVAFTDDAIKRNFPELTTSAELNHTVPVAAGAALGTPLHSSMRTPHASPVAPASPPASAAAVKRLEQRLLGIEASIAKLVAAIHPGDDGDV